MQREVPKPLRRYAGLFESIDWLATSVQWLIEATLILQHGQEQLIHMTDALGNEVANTQAGVAQLGTTLGDVATRITAELQQLVDAKANNNQAGIDQAVSNLQGVNSQLSQLAQQAQQLSVSLTSDDSTAAPPPATP